MDADPEVDGGESTVFPALRVRRGLEEENTTSEAPRAFFKKSSALLGVGEFEPNEENAVRFVEEFRAPSRFSPP